MFRNFLKPAPGKNLFGIGDSSNDGDKKLSLPENLQMSIDIAGSMQSLVNMLVADGQPASKVQEEMQPLHDELVKLLQACIEANKEIEKRHKEELESSKFVMEQVQSQLTGAKKEQSETQMELKKTKDKYQQSKDDLKQAQKDLKDAMKTAEEAKKTAEKAQKKAGAEEQDPSLEPSARESSADVQMMQSQVESLQQKLEHRQSRIDNLQHILSMKDREHETELTRQKARASMMLQTTPESENEEIYNLQVELEETREELDLVKDELEQQTELMIEAEDKLKEADQAIYNKTQMEDRIGHLSEALQLKTEELDEIETELEQMHEMMEQTKNIMNEQSVQLEEKEMELEALRSGGSQQAFMPAAADESVANSLKEKLEETKIQLEEREDDIKKLKDDLQNAKEITEIQAQVIQDYKNNPPAPAPAPMPSSDDGSDDEYELGKISIAEHMETVQDLQEQLDIARDKIADQSRQINEQHQKINDVDEAPWREQAHDGPNLDEIQKELDDVTEQNSQMKKRIEGIEYDLEVSMKEVEQQAALIQSKDEEIRSLEQAQDKIQQSRDKTNKSSRSSIANKLEEKERTIEALEMQLIEADEEIQKLQMENLAQDKPQQSRGETNKSSSSSTANELEEKERTIEALETQLAEADDAIQKLQKEHVAQRKSMAATNNTAREEREAFISSLEMQLEDADTTIRKVETRLREKDKEIKRLETDLGETRRLLDDAKQEENLARSLDSKDSDEKGAEIIRLEKKLKNEQAKAIRGEDEVEEKLAEIAQLEKKLKDVQAKAIRDQDEVEEKYAANVKLEKKLKDLQAKANRGETEVEEKQAEIKRLEKKLKDLQAKSTRDATEVEEKDTEIARLEKKLKDAQRISIRSETEVEERDAEIARLEKKLKGLQARSSSDETVVLEEKDAEIARLEKKLKEVQERAMSEEDFAGVQKALLHADKSMKKGQKQITKLTEQLEGTEKAKTELGQELSRVQGLINQKDATIKSLEQKLEGAEASLSMSQEELQAQAKELGKIKKAIKAIEKESRDGMDESQSTIRSLREEVESSKREIGGLRGELAKRIFGEDASSGTSNQVGLEVDKLKASLLEKEKLAKSQGQKIEKLNAAIKTLKEMANSTTTEVAGSHFGEKTLPASRVSTEAMTHEELGERLKVLEQHKANSAAEAERKEREICSLKKELDSAREEAQKLASVRKALEVAKDTNDLAAGTLPVNASKIRLLQASLEQQEKELDKLRIEKQSLEEKLRALVSNVTSDHNKSIQSLENEIGLHEKGAMIESLEKELHALTSSDKQTTKGSVETSGNITQLQADVKVRDQTIIALQGKLTELERESMARSALDKVVLPGDTRAMGEELIRAQKTISDLQKEIGDLEGNMKQALSALIKEKDSEIKRLGDEFANATKVVVEKEAEIASLKLQLVDKEKTLAMTIGNREEQVAELEKRKKLISVMECEIEQAKKGEETKINEFNVTLETLTQQLEISEESIRTLQRKEQEAKRQSMQDIDDTKAEIEKMKERNKTLQAEVNKKNQDKIRIKELESQLEREVEQSIDVARKKQSEIDVLASDLQNANARIEDLGEMLRSDREKKARKISKDEHRIIDLSDRLEQEVDHSASLKKQLETYKHSLKAKRKIIDSQAHELRECQDKIDMHDSIRRKDKRKMKQLENEIWNLEGELENINSYLQGMQPSRRPDRHHRGYGGGQYEPGDGHYADPRGMDRHHRGYGGGHEPGDGHYADPKGMQGPYIDDVQVNQYLDHFSKKVHSARRRLEAAQDRMHKAK